MNFLYAYILLGAISALGIKWTNTLMTKGRVVMNYIQFILVLIGWPLILPMFLIVGVPNLIENKRKERITLPSRQ
jgi:TM2 domain-containing membrane protein YozV